MVQAALTLLREVSNLALAVAEGQVGAAEMAACAWGQYSERSSGIIRGAAVGAMNRAEIDQAIREQELA